MNKYLLTILKITTQLTVMSPVLYFYFVDLESAGNYLKWAPLFSVLIELSAFEWVKIAVLKERIGKDELIFRRKAIFISYLISFFAILYFLDARETVLVITCLLLPLMSQHYVDTYSLPERINKNERRFHKRFVAKSLIVDILIPIFVMFSLIMGFESYLYPIAILGYLTLFSMTIWVYSNILNYSKEHKFDESFINIYFYALLKRLDSQSLRLTMAFFLPEKVLGQLVPITLISRGINVVGNFTNYLFLHRNNEITARYLNNIVVIPCLIILPIIISISAHTIFNYVGLYEFNIYYASVMLSLNISAVVKLFIRGVRLREGKIRDIFSTLVLNILLKGSVFSLVFFIDQRFALLAIIYMAAEIVYESHVAKRLTINEHIKN